MRKTGVIISSLIEQLQEIKAQYGDLPISTGAQGTETIRTFDPMKDMHLYGVGYDIMGLMINENAVEVSSKQHELAMERARACTRYITGKDLNDDS